MAKRIVTKDKKDIVTGFDLKCDVNVYAKLKQTFDGIGGQFFQMFGDVLAQTMAQDNASAMVEWLNEQVDEAEECFIEEASLSKWSGNMIDNSVCGVSGTLPEMKGYTLFMDLRIGVNHNEIMNTGNWQSHANKFYGKSSRFKNAVIYTYNGRRMKPGVDYSIWLNSGDAEASLPVSAGWAGFVERAEERFWA